MTSGGPFYYNGSTLFSVWISNYIHFKVLEAITYPSNPRLQQLYHLSSGWIISILVQMITTIRRCVACDDLWPWPISSRSFGLGLENRVRSVASTVLDGLFPYLVQMITSIRRCVACDDLWPWPISSRSLDLDFENHVCSVTFSVLDRLFPYLPQIITTIRGCVAC